MDEETAGAIHHQAVEKELRELKGHVQSLLQTARGFYFYRVGVEPGNPPTTRVVMVSPSIIDVMGIEDVNNFESWFANIHPDDKPRIMETHQRSIETGTPFDQVARWYHSVRREWVWLRAMSQPVYSPEGVITHFNGICIDITQQRQSEESLKESESRFRSLIEGAPEAIFVECEGRCRYINPAMLKLLGATKAEDMLGGDVFARIAPEYHEMVSERIRYIHETGRPAPLKEMEYLRFDGSRISVETTAVSIVFQNRDANLVFVRDITERKQVEEQNRANLTRLNLILSNAPLILSAVNLKGEYILSEGKGLAGLDREQGKLPDVTIFEVYKTRPDIIGYIRSAMSGNSVKAEIELAGQVLEVDYEPLKDGSGRIIGAVALSQIITGRKRAEKLLHERNVALDHSVVQLRRLAMELTRAEDRERKRLATKLHDDVQQWLVAATMKISLLNQPASGEERDRLVQEAQHLVGEALNATRSLTTDLYPPVLLDGGFLPGLRWLADRMRDTHDLTVEVAGDDVQNVPEPLSILLFLGVRELLFNVVKHANVKTARVVVSQPDSKTIQVEVNDCGIGFAGNHTSRGLGMFHLRERLAYVGGSLDVVSVPGQGTRVSITVPIG